MNHKHRPQSAAAGPGPDRLVKMHEDLLIQYNNLALEMEQRMASGEGGQMSEALTDLDWTNRIDKDYMWVRMSGANSPLFQFMTKEIIDNYAYMADFMAVFNPLIKRIVEVKTQFTFALNCSVTSETLQDEIDAILKDELNEQFFFGSQPLGDIDACSQKHGNVLFAIWKETQQIRAWDNYRVRDVIRDPEDASRPLFYVCSWMDDKGKEQKRAYPSLFIKDEEMRDAKTEVSYLGSSYPVDQEIRVYHMSSRKGINQKFALSELVAACRWARPHEKYIEDFHAIVSAVRKITHTMTTKGTTAQMNAMAGQLRTPGPAGNTPGSIAVSQEGTELKVMDAGSGKIIGIEGARASLMQVCAASGVPETYLTMDPSTGNLATAKEISPVFVMLIQFRQTIWKNALTAIFKYMLDSDEFEVSFPPIRDNINDYVTNVNKFAMKPDGTWTGAIRGKDYVKAAHEALEWKLPPKDEVEEMGAMLDAGAMPAEPDPTDQGLTDIARAAQGLVAQATQQQGSVDPDKSVPPVVAKPGGGKPGTGPATPVS